jgi:hypothetical protein
MRKTHGMYRTPTHYSWQSMLGRCTYGRHPAFARYGGRGITVCPEWYSFENFYRDMGERPIGRTLDRLDNEKGYSKENCRWATPFEQQVNRRGKSAQVLRGLAHKPKSDPIKECPCGALFRSIPKHARVSADPVFAGHYWECCCASTLFVPARRSA